MNGHESGPGGGLCKYHAEHKVLIAEIEKSLERSKKDVDRLWDVIGNKLSIKVFCWIIGTVLCLTIAGAGTFAVAQRETVEAQKEAIEDNRATIRATDQKFQTIQSQLKEINVHLQYMRKELDEEDERRDRADRRTRNTSP